MNPYPFLEVAAELAMRFIGEPQDYYLAAVGLRRDGALVHSTNKAVRTITSRGNFSPRLYSTHAEVRLCRKMDTGGNVYVARVLRNGNWANARPCARCLAFLIKRRLNVVHFTISPDEFGTIKLAT